MSDLPHYGGWAAVPAHLATASRLKELDLPRQPGPIAAIVTGGDYRGKSDVFELYDLATSPPTKATAKQLEAAAARRKHTACTECGAHPDTGLSQVTGRCETCLHIDRLRRTQAEARHYRAEYARWAAERLGNPKTIVAWIGEHTAPPTPSRAKPKPVAHTVTITTPHGKPVLNITHRLPGIGPRVRGVPDGAVPFEHAAAAVAELGERYFVTWTYSNLHGLVRLATGESRAYLAPHGAEMNLRVSWWRGDIDPRRPGHPRAAIAPGNAERLALLLRRMAADNHPENTGA